MKTYVEQFFAFLSDYQKIRYSLDLDSNFNGQLQNFHFNKYLQDNESIENELVSILTSVNQKVMFVAPTGAGKTYEFLNVFNRVKENNTQEDTLDGFVQIERQAINILFTPKKIQNIQNQNKYENVKSITMNDNIDIEDIENYKNFSVVYDKADEVYSTLETLFDSESYRKMYYCNIVIDECHLLTSAQYRKAAIKKLLNLIDLVSANGGNIVYTTGTFQNCYMLDFERAIICESDSKSNIGKIEEIINQPGVDSKDFVLNMVQKELNNNNKVFLRINNKDIIDNLKTMMETKGYKVAILTSEEKDTSSLYKEIVDNSKLDDTYDLIILTCIIDEGVTLDTTTSNETPDNIVPMFFMDNSNTNLLDFKQFTNRIRWNLNKAILLVDKHESNIEDTIIQLSDIAKEEAKNPVLFYNSFKNILVGFQGIYKDEKEVANHIEQLLNEKDYFGRPNHMGLFSYNGNIEFDYLDCFNRMFIKYMNQFINFDIERKYLLQDLFGVEVSSSYVDLNDVQDKYIDYTSIKFEDFLAKAYKDSELQKKLKEKELDDLREVKRDKRFEQLMKLIDKTEDVKTSINLLTHLTKKEIDSTIKNMEKEDLLKVSAKQCKLIDLYVSKENDSVLDYETRKVINSDYYELIKDAANLGIDSNKFKTLCENRSFEEMQLYLKEEQIIKNNNAIKKGKVAGRSCMEQHMLVTIIDNMKMGKNQVTLDESKFIEIKDLMCKTTKSNWTKIAIKKFVLIAFNVDEDKKNKKYIVKSLRMYH